MRYDAPGNELERPDEPELSGAIPVQLAITDHRPETILECFGVLRGADPEGSSQWLERLRSGGALKRVNDFLPGRNLMFVSFQGRPK